MIGAIAVGVLSWLAFVATTVLASLHVLRTRGSGDVGGSVGMKQHGEWVGGRGKGDKKTTTVTV